MPISSQNQSLELNKDLLDAVRAGDVKNARRSIIMGADVNTIVDFAGAPLIITTFADSFEMASLLLDNGAHINARDIYGKTAVISCVMYRSKRVLKLLIQSNADLNVVDTHGRTALDYAIEHDWKEGARMLWLAGAKRSIEL